MNEQDGTVDTSGAEARIRQLIAEKKTLEARLAVAEENAANRSEEHTSELQSH